MGIILAIALSLDALGMGISCGLRRQRLGFFAYASLFVISAIVMGAATFFGSFLTRFLSADAAMYASAFWLVALGVWISFSALTKKETQENIPQNITKRGAIQLALILSLDSIGAGLAAASLGISVVALPFLVAIFQISFLAIGTQIPGWLRLKTTHQRRWSVASGAILVAMGLLRLI